MDRLAAMETLLAAVDGGSLSAASRTLGMPLATVSRRVSDLEAHLRTPLVVRTSRRLALTEAGTAYVAACRRIVDDVHEAERRAAGEYRVPQGSLTVTAPIVFGRLHVEPVVLDFLAAYPKIVVRLVLADTLLNFADDQVDAAIRIGLLPDSSLKAVRLGAIARVVCASPDYLRRRGEPRVPDDLGAHDCILFDGLAAAEGWRFRDGEGERLIPLRPRLVVTTAEAAIDAALAGAGLTRVLSYQIAEAVRAGRLVPVLRDVEPAALPAHLVYGAQALLPLKLRAFVDFAASRLKVSVASAAL